MSSSNDVREAVGVFHDVDSLRAAIDELLSSGFDRAELSLLAGEEAVEKKLGGSFRAIRDVEDEAEVPRIAYLSTEDVGAAEGAVAGVLLYIGATAATGAVVASGGTLAAAIAALALGAGTGGTVGAVLARFIGDAYGDYLSSQLDRGGLLLWVCLRDPAHESQALKILARNGADDLHVHSLTGAAAAARDINRRMSALVDEAGLESFPASDPPAYNMGREGSDP